DFVFGNSARRKIKKAAHLGERPTTTKPISSIITSFFFKCSSPVVSSLCIFITEEQTAENLNRKHLPVFFLKPGTYPCVVCTFHIFKPAFAAGHLYAVYYHG